MIIEGNVKVGTRTKDLAKYLSPGDIAVLQHDDIDELAAEALLNAKLKAIINTGSSMSGRYFSRGTALLIQNHARVFDANLHITTFADHDLVRIKGKDLIINNHCVYSNSCTRVNEDYIRRKTEAFEVLQSTMISNFLDNTLEHAKLEKDIILNFNAYPDLETVLNGRPAVVVVRSPESKECMESLHTYIEAYNPVLIGVDGGADVIIGCGYTPDILLGDMDSVSDIGIFRSREVILHAYMDGKCPCLDRIAPMNIKYKLLPMPGTSEDIALLLAYDKGASSIVLIGGHSSITDFWERGRNGMGSTLITRLKIEDRLIDYKHLKLFMNMKEKELRQQFLHNEGELKWLKM